MNGASNKHVPALSHSLTQAELIIVLLQYINLCLMEGILVHIWRSKWNRFLGSDGGRKIDEEGLSTNLWPKSKSAMNGSNQLEILLTQLERELLSIEWSTEIP